METPTSSNNLRSVRDLAPCFRPLYPSFEYFNIVQSDCFDAAYSSDHNMVVAAPTGSGKTIVMELCILHVFLQSVDRTGKFHPQQGRMKIVYIAPTRSLVQERVRDWTNRFGNSLGAKVSELTGDIDNIRSHDIDIADIICATPEKFDAVSRKHQDYGGTRFFGDICLMLIDEVHLLNESRGSVLEAGVVSRIRVVSRLDSMKNKFPIAKVRFVAVSATVPNANDLAIWLNVPPQALMVYGDDVRPVKLKTIVRGYPETRNDFLFERRLNDYLYPVIVEFSSAKPTLVFCSSRKGTSDTANFVVEQSKMQFPNRLGSPFVRDMYHLERLTEASKKASNKQLGNCLVNGVAFHHAGMDAADRSLVESVFLNHDILVLCTTGTLAMGVNLPAHLVVIKGTRYYCGAQESGLDHNGYKEYERGMCLQMIGRAGRPQFDTEGIAVIMTQRQHRERYEDLAMGCEELESQLKSCFAEYLNAEIVLGTIKSIPLAVEWLKSTFMYIRAMKNPHLYGMPSNVTSREQFEEMMKQRLIMANLSILQKHKMVEIEENKNGLVALECGRLMAYYYIKMNTMIYICDAPSHASIPDLIQIISHAEELESIRLRRGEKKQLNDINCRRTNPSIKFQVLDGAHKGKAKQRISTPDEKIFILVNDALSETPSDTLDVSLRQEMSQIVKVAETVTRCMMKYYASISCLAGAANSRILFKCIKARMWDDNCMQCKQLPNIGKLLGERLSKGGIGRLKDLAKTDPRRIESVTMKHYPFGNTLLQDLHKRMPPELDLQIYHEGCFDGRLRIQLRLQRTHEENSGCQMQFMGSSFICGTIHDDKLLLNQSINLKTFPSPYSVYVYIDRLISNQKPIEVVASVILEKLVGLDVTKKLVIPFDAQSHDWKTNHQISQVPGATPEKECPPDDVLNNNGDVIRGLSHIVERNALSGVSVNDPAVADGDFTAQQIPTVIFQQSSKFAETSQNTQNNAANPTSIGTEKNALPLSNLTQGMDTAGCTVDNSGERLFHGDLSNDWMVKSETDASIDRNQATDESFVDSPNRNGKRVLNARGTEMNLDNTVRGQRVNMGSDAARRQRQTSSRPRVDWCSQARAVLQTRSQNVQSIGNSPGQEQSKLLPEQDPDKHLPQNHEIPSQNLSKRPAVYSEDQPPAKRVSTAETRLIQSSLTSTSENSEHDGAEIRRTS